MGKVRLTKKDHFVIGKNKKHFNKPTSKQKCSTKPHLNYKQTASSSSGHFFIKHTEKPHQTRVKGSCKNACDEINSSESLLKTDIKEAHIKPFSKKSRSHNSSKNLTEQLKTNQVDMTKKPFDKKKWRLQKYSKKYKLEQWEDNRKKSLLQEFRKQMEKEPVFDVKKIYDKFTADEEDNDNDNNLNNLESTDASSSNDTSHSKSTITRNAQIQFQEKQIQKKLKKEEIEKKKAEKAEAIKVYKQKKLEKYKKLNKKTKKGQPVMKYRMEMLLEQIQKSLQ